MIKVARRHLLKTGLVTTAELIASGSASVLTEPTDTPFGRRAVVKDFEGHKVELYERG